LIVEVPRELLLADEVVAGDLDGRLADLPARLVILLEERDRGVGHGVPELTRQEVSREPATKDCYVDVHRSPPLGLAAGVRGEI
jgi:hypothetical protein